MQNGQWVFISAFFQLSPYLTPKDLSISIYCITPLQFDTVCSYYAPALTQHHNEVYQNK